MIATNRNEPSMTKILKWWSSPNNLQKRHKQHSQFGCTSVNAKGHGHVLSVYFGLISHKNSTHHMKTIASYNRIRDFNCSTKNQYIFSQKHNIFFDEISRGSPYLPFYYIYKRMDIYKLQGLRPKRKREFMLSFTGGLTLRVSAFISSIKQLPPRCKSQWCSIKHNAIPMNPDDLHNKNDDLSEDHRTKTLSGLKKQELVV